MFQRSIHKYIDSFSLSLWNFKKEIKYVSKIKIQKIKTKMGVIKISARWKSEEALSSLICSINFENQFNKVEEWERVIITKLLKYLHFWRTKIYSLGRCDPWGYITLKEIHEDLEMLKNWSTQILFKMNLFHRAWRYLSNGAKIASNGVCMRKLWPLKVLVKKVKNSKGVPHGTTRMVTHGTSVHVMT